MRKYVSTLLIAMLLSACSTVLKQHDTFTLADGTKVDYITGKVAGDGQESNFRDAFIDGKPVLSNYGSGPSLTGQVLNGVGAAALISGGMVGSSAVLRPTRVNGDTTTLSNDSASDSKNLQLQGQTQQSTNINANSTSVKVKALGGAGGSGGGCKGNCGGGPHDD